MIKKIRTCIHCLRTSNDVEFYKRKRIRKCGTFVQYLNICITCQREQKAIRSFRNYHKNKEIISLRRRKRSSTW